MSEMEQWLSASMSATVQHLESAHKQAAFSQRAAEPLVPHGTFASGSAYCTTHDIHTCSCAQPQLHQCTLEILQRASSDLMSSHEQYRAASSSLAF
jgi:hypothetical protein